MGQSEGPLVSPAQIPAGSLASIPWTRTSAGVLSATQRKTRDPGGCNVPHTEDGSVRRCRRRRFRYCAIDARAGGGDAPWRGAVQRRSRLQQGAAQVRAAGQTYYGKPINFVLHRNSELGLE